MKYWVWMLATISLASCATAPQLPEELKYVMPSESEVGIAKIAATLIDDKVPLFDHDNTYVYAVDGKQVMLGRKQWDQPVFIRPGTHDVTLGFEKGVYMFFAKVRLEVSESGSYSAKSACKKGAFGDFQYCDFWIVDTTKGTAITEVARGAYSRGQHPLNL